MPKSIIIDGVVHEGGIENCNACEGGEVLGPCPKSRCSGLVHQQVIDSYNDIFSEKCDVCESS